MSRSMTTAGVEVRSSSRTSTSTRNPRSTPGHPHSTRKSQTTQADNSSTEDPRNPDSHHKHGGAAPVMWRCTRYVAVHPNRRGALPTDRVQCPNKQEQTRNWHTEPLTATPSMRNWALLAAGWARRPRHHLHSGPIRHLLHPYMQRARLPSPSHAEKGVGPGVSSGAHPQSVRIRPASRRRCARGTWPAAR